MTERSVTPIRTVALFVAWACVMTLAVLSWTPGQYMERTQLPGLVEHFIAYALTASVVGVASPRLRYAILLILYAAVLEAGQLIVPLRHAAVADFAAGALGVVGASALVWAMRHRWPLALG